MKKIKENIKINTKSARKNHSNQKGITLIALVVTIVVLLILAGVSINAVFSDSGIIARAKDAQNRMNQATQNELDTIDELNDFVNSKINKTTGENTPPVEPTEDTAPYYPDTTFTKLEGTDLSNGLVIQDQSKNEYVWIEVPKSLYNDEAYNKDTEETDINKQDKKPKSSIDYDNIEYCLHKYTETYRNGTSYTDTYYSDATTGLTSDEYTALKQKMLKSVYENGGFWIGRYEAGITENRTAKGDATTAPISKAGTVENPVYPYTYVTCSQAQTLANMKTTANYTSSLMFGVQWDLVLKHIEIKEVEKGTALETIQNDLKTDSSSWGNYKDASFTINRGKYADYKSYSLSTTWTPYNQTTSNNFVNSSSVKQTQSSAGNGILLTTGASEACKKMNIYDLAGNVCEWTLEYSASTGPCARRGGNSNRTGSYCPASNRLNHATTFSLNSIGFRPSLYK